MGRTERTPPSRSELTRDRYGVPRRAEIRDGLIADPAEAMQGFQGELPFAAIADPDKKLYADFGVESSLKAVLNPRALLAGFRARSVVHSVRDAMGRAEKHLGLPADFLIGPDGLVLAAKHGKYADDQGSVDELLVLARSHSR